MVLKTHELIQKGAKLVTVTSAFSDGRVRTGDEKVSEGCPSPGAEPPDPLVPAETPEQLYNPHMQATPYQIQNPYGYYGSNHAIPRTQFHPGYPYLPQQRPSQNVTQGQYPQHQGAYTHAHTHPAPFSNSYTHQNTTAQYGDPPQQQQFSPGPRRSIDSYNPDQSYSTAPHNNQQQYFQPPQSPPQSYQASPPPQQGQWSPTPVPHAQLLAPQRGLSYEQPSVYAASGQLSENTARSLVYKSDKCVRDPNHGLLNSMGRCLTCDSHDIWRR